MCHDKNGAKVKYTSNEQLKRNENKFPLTADRTLQTN